MLLTLLGINAPVSAVVVNFPDANLEAVVRDRLAIPEPTPIYDTDMATMEWLYADRSSISNIIGLEYGSNLTSLDLSRNQINDISAVSGLTNLTRLSLCDNQISDISAVSPLTNMTTLDLPCNQINDISAVSGLTNLTRLNLGDNQISDISAVSPLTNLTSLDLSCNQINDISAVSGLTNLSLLGLYGNQISDISAVSGLTNLRFMDLWDNQIETLDLRNSNLASLESFSIFANPLTNVLLTDATLSQSVFDALITGIARPAGVLSIDMSGVDFAGISDLSTMFAADDLETLLLAEATNLDGSQVVPLTAELNSLVWLEVTGLWDSFDVGTQNSLNTWDAIEGNTLVIIPLFCGDCNKDGTINEADAAILAANWQSTGATWETGDFNGDGVVNDIDATLLAANWNPGTSAYVPEPTTITLLLCGLASLLCLRRHKLKSNTS